MRKRALGMKLPNRWQSTGGERELGLRRLGLRGLFGRLMAMRAARTAGFGAGAKGFVDDALDGARAAAALGAATEAAIDLLRVARQVCARGHGIADVVVAEDVTGANDHSRRRARSVMLTNQILNTTR